MKPTQSMFANQADWIKAFADWMDDVPTSENEKLFMIFDQEVNPDSLIFRGSCLSFADCFFSGDWPTIINWVEENGYKILLEGEEEFENMDVILEVMDDEEIAAEEERVAAKWADNDPDGDRYLRGGSEFAEILRDQRKYGD